ncbi:MAG TPA: hypothetical protein VE377_14680 [Candidatus Dormibacteraeota bacterium]|nr:hypothetical protein [Candidatus Dormibacteraeota bacterium]
MKVQFKKRLRRGYTGNAELSPPADAHAIGAAEAGEIFLVRIVATNSGKRYWLTDRRMLVQSDRGMSELFRYCDLRRIHWMFRDPLRRAFASPNPQEEIARMKSAHYDRLELELANGEVVLEHLGPAYSLVFEFLRFLIKPSRARETT